MEILDHTVMQLLQMKEEAWGCGKLQSLVLESDGAGLGFGSEM